MARIAERFVTLKGRGDGRIYVMGRSVSESAYITVQEDTGETAIHTDKTEILARYYPENGAARNLFKVWLTPPKEGKPELELLPPAGV